MKAVITVIGRDAVGILAKVSTECAAKGANIIDVTQSVMSGMFTMIMLVELNGLTSDFSELVNSLEALGEQIGMKVHVMHEDIFNSMHRI